MKAKIIVLILVFCSLTFAGPCFAHKVRIFAWNEGNIIHTESKFSGGKAAQNATVTVIESSTGTELVRGKTDEQGLFQFPAPTTTSKELEIIVNSGDGHKNHWLYEINPDSKSTTVQPQLPPHSPTVSPQSSPSSPSLCLTEEQLTTLMDNLLEAKLAPIRQQLAEQQEQEPSLQDILGGIGYILGLAGIAAYMKSKK